MGAKRPILLAAIKDLGVARKADSFLFGAVKAFRVGSILRALEATPSDDLVSQPSDMAAAESVTSFATAGAGWRQRQRRGKGWRSQQRFRQGVR
jgi:hypothetical protein